MKKIAFALLSLALATTGWGQNIYNKYGPASGIQKNTGSTYQNQTATASDIFALMSGSCTVDAFIRGDASCTNKLQGSFQVTDGTGATNWVQVTSNGSLVAGNPTGGAMGLGTGNFTALYINGSAVGTSSGAVSSVGLAMPSGFCSVTGSPVTAAGTLTCSLVTQSANTVFAGPTSGAAANPAFRALVAGDLPGTISSNTTGNAATATALAATPTQCAGGNVSTGVAASGNANCTSTPPGTVTSLTAGTGVTLSPSTITATGSVGLNLGAALTWTGSPTYSATTPLVTMNSTGAALNQKNTLFELNGSGSYIIGSATDAAPGTLVTNALSFTRSGSAWSGLTFGNATDNPSFTFSGTGAVSVGGNLAVTGSATVGGQNVCVQSGTNCPAATVTGFATPTGTATLTATAGTATTAIRSDANIALDVTIAPQWTGFHVFGANSAVGALSLQNNGTAGLAWINSGAAADTGVWRAYANTSGTWNLQTVNDAHSTSKNALVITRSGTAVNAMTFGNSTDNPQFNFNGTGTATFGGSITSGGQNVCLANGTGCPGGITGLAAASGTVGLSAVAGSATTAARSDSTPALSQSIAPLWTGTHMFNGGVITSVTNAGVNIGQSAGVPVFRFVDTNGGTNGKAWQISTSGSDTHLSFGAITDDFATTFSSFMVATRATAAAQITNLSFGNPTDNPSFNFNGSGVTSFGGPINANTSTGVAITANGVSGQTAVVVNPAAGTTGIAIVAPTANGALLVLRGNNNAGSAAGQVSQDGSNNVHLANVGAASVDLDTNGVNRLALDQNGDFTLNTPTSGTVLTVNAGTSAPAVFNGSNAAGGAAITAIGNFTGAGTTNLVSFKDPNNTNGVNLQLVGNGATTPNKTIRVAAGTLQVLNSAYTSSLLSLNDSGNVTFASTGSQPQYAFNTSGVNAQGIISAPSTFASSFVVAGNGNGTTTGVLLQQDTSHNGYLRNQDTGALFLGVGSTNYWEINANGGLIENTTVTSGHALTIDGNASSSAVTVDSAGFAWTTQGAIDMGTTGGVEGDSGVLNLANNVYFASPNWTYKTTAPASYVRQDASGNILLATAASGTAGLAATLTNAMEVFNDRGVIIGNPNGGDLGAGILNVQNGIDIGGTVAPLYNGGAFTPIQQVNAASGNAWTSAFRWTNDGSGPGLMLGKSRGTSIGTQTAVLNTDQLGTIMFDGSDGTSLQTGAQISAAVDGTPGAASMPGKLVFATTPSGSNSVTTRLSIFNDGGVSCAALADKGASTFNCGTLYQNGTALAPVATSGSAADLSAGTLLAARMPALTGDCTTTAGAVATTCTKTNGVAFATVATSGSASDLTTGTLSAVRLPAALSSSTSVNGTTIPASTTFATVATSGSASDLGTGTLAAARLPAALSSSTSVNGTTIPASATLCQSTGAGCPTIATFKFASGVVTIGTSTCTVVVSQGNTSSCSPLGTGLVQINFSPAFSSATCVADAVDTSPVQIAGNPGSGITSNADFTLRNSSSSNVNGNLSFVCFGT